MSSDSDSRESGGGLSRGRELAALLVPGAFLALLVMTRGDGIAFARGVSQSNTVAPFRVCADPNNMPFSDSLRNGFENKIAALIASDLKAPLEYTWLPQRRGFVRNTLKQGECDVMIGVPAGYDMVSRTAPYYQSTYVFVTRKDRHLAIGSLDDQVLRPLKIGVHLMGDDYANSPAAIGLLRRGLGANIVGVMIYGDYSKASPPSQLIDDVVEGKVDVAIAWGPLAGYYAKHSATPLVVTPVHPAIDLPFVPYTYAIAMGVRRGDSTRKAMLESELDRRGVEIRRILAEYGVPLVGRAGE